MGNRVTPFIRQQLNPQTPLLLTKPLHPLNEHRVRLHKSSVTLMAGRTHGFRDSPWTGGAIPPNLRPGPQEVTI